VTGATVFMRGPFDGTIVVVPQEWPTSTFLALSGKMADGTLLVARYGEGNVPGVWEYDRTYFCAEQRWEDLHREVLDADEWETIA